MLTFDTPQGPVTSGKTPVVIGADGAYSAVRAKLQTQPGASQAILSAEQAREIERFREKQLDIRKRLRAVKAGLEQDIKDLGMWMKFINIFLVPLAFAGVALLVAMWHRRRRHAIAMLRKGGTP